jgi:1-deoxy-D-xylulose-5-phosphate synthase
MTRPAPFVTRAEKASESICLNAAKCLKSVRAACLSEVEAAAEALSAKGITPTIADARFAKPLDRDMILKLAADHEALITIEEGAIGGFGSHVAQLLAEEGVFDTGVKFRSMVLPDTFIDHASPTRMYEEAKLSAKDIEAKILSLMTD